MASFRMQDGQSHPAECSCYCSLCHSCSGQSLQLSISNYHLTVWGVEPVVTQQTSWLEGSDVCGLRQKRQKPLNGRLARKEPKVPYSLQRCQTCCRWIPHDHSCVQQSACLSKAHLTDMHFPLYGLWGLVQHSQGYSPCAVIVAPE